MPVDLRSDTVTKPTAAMRRAMAEAEVGDDVFGDDPTINRLETRTAELLGKPAAVFVPSGTMANQLAIRSHTESGDEILVESTAHIYSHEAGAPAALAGVLCRLIVSERGIFGPDDIAAHVRPANPYFAPSKLVCVENTHNRGGGSVWPLAAIGAVAAEARRHGLRLHLDGARLWNASVASGVPEADFARPFDSVSVCFSKGLGAPVGSALCGDDALIQRARRFRKMYGGGMRQAGILAAGALHALDHHRERLAEDHAHARRLAEGLAATPGIELDPATVETNIVIFRVATLPAPELSERLRAAGVLMLATGPQTLRAVTNLEVDDQGIETALAAVRRGMP